MNKKTLKSKKGITLIALTVTIVVLIILASISIGVLGGEDGLINQAKLAKEETEISEEKELLGRATVQVAGKDVYGNIEEEALQKELDKEAGEGKIEVTDTGEEFEVIFKENNRYYIIDKEGNVGEVQGIIEDKNPGDITKDKDGNELDGSEEKPYEIWCIEDLVDWSLNYEKYQNSNIILCRDLNFKSSLSYNNSDTTIYEDINKDGNIQELIEEMQKGIGFTPIEQFNGMFNGQEFKIKNIYICREKNAGLILTLSGTIKNIEISGFISSDNGYSGGIVAIGSKNIIINNCVNRANVITNNTLGEIDTGTYSPGSSGGIIGLFNGTITNCYNFGKIYGVSNSGGIGGYKYAGNDTQLLNCLNEGEIQGEGNSGGIIGKVVAGGVEIYNCYNNGIVDSGIVGGIFGYKSNTTFTRIKNSFNVGKLFATKNLGEIIGYNWAYNEETSPIVENVYYFNNNNNAFGSSQQWVIGEVTYYNNIFSDKFIEILNTYIIENLSFTMNWNKWKLGEDGYPTFE